MNKLLTAFLALLTLVILAACGGSASTPAPTPTQPAAPPTPESTPAAADNAAAAYNGPDWTRIALTDARTGSTFTLADFAGKTVFVHPMARW